MSKKIRAVVYDDDTVEDVTETDRLSLCSNAEYEAHKQFAQKCYEVEKRDRLSYLDSVADGGSYVWNYFVPLEANFDKVINSTVTRLVYLATFMNKNNYIAYDNGVIMNRRQIQNLLGLEASTFKRFLKDATESGYLSEDGIGFRLRSEKFGRGTMQKDGNQRATKLFVYSVRFLYETATVSSHKSLAYLYMIIPYVNLTYNVLCENPLETDRDKVKKMSVSALCEKLGVDQSNATRFVNQLLRIEYPDRFGDTRSILVSVKDSKNSHIREFLCVNPRLYSAYADKQRIMEITGLNDIFLIEEGEL